MTHAFLSTEWMDAARAIREKYADQVPEIDDLDLNPLFALEPGSGCRIVDARVHVKRGY